MKLPRIFENKFIIICIQFLILSLFLFIFEYHFDIAFDSLTSEVHRQIIQILANYILYSSWSELIFIYIVWILVALIPIFIYRNLRKAYSTNLLIFFLPNFFFYVFLSRYSPDYFNLEFPNLIIKSIVLCITIISISIGFSLLLNRLLKKDLAITKKDLEAIQKETTMICPTCGTQFKSIPKYCYKCSTKLIKDNKE